MSINSVSSPLIASDPSTNNQWSRAAVAAGSALDSAERNMLKAFSLSEGSAEFNSFAKKMGMKPDKDGKYSLSGLQMFLQLKYDKAKQAFQTLSQILFGRNDVIQRIIDKIGR